jgi:hypothetical protein
MPKVVKKEKKSKKVKIEAIIDSQAPSVFKNADEPCRKCGSLLLRKVEDEALKVCTSCGCVHVYLDTASNTLAYGESVEHISFSYRRMHHLSEFLNHFQWKESTVVPDGALEAIGLEIKTLLGPSSTKNDVSFNHVYDAVRSLKLNAYYDNTMQIWCKLTEHAPIRFSKIQEEKIRLMFNRIQHPFGELHPIERKNFLSYPYCVYKFCQLLGYKEHLSYFHLLKVQARLAVQEDIFKAICSHVGWKFIPYDETVESL